VYSTLCPAVEALLLSRKCQLLTRRTNRKERMLKTMEKKPKFILQGVFAVILFGKFF
jgi:hypothetical protein